MQPFKYFIKFLSLSGNMPARKDKLSNREIKLILTWITAQWSDEIYTAWYNQYHQEK